MLESFSLTVKDWPWHKQVLSVYSYHLSFQNNVYICTYVNMYELTIALQYTPLV